jgi:glycerol kinase
MALTRHRLWLAIDQGGQSSRALVYDDDGRIVARAQHGIAPDVDMHGHIEYDPHALLESLHAVVREAGTQLGARCKEIAAAGLATQRSTIACWDRMDGTPLSPVISWQDRRASEWMASFQGQRARIKTITGLVPSAHYGASKLHWCLQHLPTVQTAEHDGRLAWGPMASFLLHGLLTERPNYADPVNASRTLLWDIERLDWSEELIGIFGLPRAPLPTTTANAYLFGHLPIGDTEVPMRLTTGDQAAALFHHGTPRTDTLYVTLGTGAFLQQPTGTTRLDAEVPLLRSIVHLDEAGPQYVLEGTINGAGAALEWLAQTHRAAIDAAALNAALALPTEPPLFLNGVSGLGTPFMRPQFIAHFHDQGDADDTRAMTLAVLESIVFLLQVNIEAMARAGATPARRIAIGGGLARLDGLCQRLADLSGIPVERDEEHETTSRGLLHLLRTACGAQGDPGTTVAAKHLFTPREHPVLARRYARWHEILLEHLARNP